MSDYKPGTVAVATVRGVKGVRVFCYEERNGLLLWDSAGRIEDSIVHMGDDVTDIRPLVVLELNDPSVRRVIDVLRMHHLDLIAEHIEAQTKPPRIPEPGLWGIVEAGVKQHDVRLRWVRLGGNYRSDDDDEYDRMWSDLIDPVLIREGLS